MRSSSELALSQCKQIIKHRLWFIYGVDTQVSSHVYTLCQANQVPVLSEITSLCGRPCVRACCYNVSHGGTAFSYVGLETWDDTVSLAFLMLIHKCAFHHYPLSMVSIVVLLQHKSLVFSSLNKSKTHQGKLIMCWSISKTVKSCSQLEVVTEQVWSAVPSLHNSQGCAAITSCCQIPQHTFRGITESMPQSVGAVLAACTQVQQ